jgi:hypothetical protein
MTKEVPFMKFERNKSARRGTQVVSIGIPTVLKNTPTKHNNYVVNQEI